MLSTWPQETYRLITYKSMQREERRRQHGSQTLVILGLHYNFQTIGAYPRPNNNYQNYAASTAQLHRRQP